MGLAFKGRARFVEADVAIAAHAEQLHINSAYLGDNRVISAAAFVRIRRQAVRHKGACLVDVDMVKQVRVHEIAVALLIVRGKAAVFVQIDGGYPGKIQVALFIPLHQLLVGAHRRRAGRQAEHAVRLHNDLRRQDVCRFPAHIRIILRFVNKHCCSPSFLHKSCGFVDCFRLLV